MDSAKKKASKPIKKRFGFWRFFRIASFTIRRSFSKKPAAVSVSDSEKGILKNLVGAMRPLHHNINAAAPSTTKIHGLLGEQHRQHSAYLPPPPPLPCRDDEDDDVEMLSLEPESRYASAENLLELDDSEDANPDEQNAINQRAEVFIANFYEQMRLQRLMSLNHYGMIEKGLY